jgi:LPXTG-site transpeptidase (sortase) family protein
MTLAVALISAMAVNAQAADYTFSTDSTPEYYPSTSYEDTYNSQYNYGGQNVIDFQIPELTYGTFSTTQTGVMEKVLLPGLQQSVATGTASGGYGISDGTTSVVVSNTATEISSTTGGSSTLLPSVPAFTKLTDSFYLSNGAIGYISIPSINIKNYYVWEGETSASMKKGVAHFSSTSVWDGNVAVCGHNRGATYVIGAIKDLSKGDTITYTTSQGTRTYQVETVVKISNDDWSYLESSCDNRITLITCVANDSSHRWCVQAVEVS